MFFHDFFYVVMSELRFLFSANKIIVVDEITIVDLAYFLVIVYKCDTFIHLCTLPIFCIVDTVLGFKHVTVLVQYNRYQQIVDVLTLQCASESIKVRPPF